MTVVGRRETEDIMFILTQNKKTLIECVRLAVTKNFGGGKEEKFALICYTYYGEGVIAATFPDEKTAADALEKVTQAIAAGEKVYRF